MIYIIYDDFLGFNVLVREDDSQHHQFTDHKATKDHRYYKRHSGPSLSVKPNQTYRSKQCR
ncbi:MAG: hypothetical protein DRH26_00045 [Deltaproteobacteria bacterium]|nr:MAG: hypothetical protein DRH26_00045 [Deltaproteobacteria bacterium]